jgi:hypothetical protein
VLRLREEQHINDNYPPPYILSRVYCTVSRVVAALFGLILHLCTRLLLLCCRCSTYCPVFLYIRWCLGGRPCLVVTGSCTRARPQSGGIPYGTSSWGCLFHYTPLYGYPFTLTARHSPTLFQLLHTPFTSSSAHLFPISSSGAKYLTQSFPYNRLLLPLLPSHLRFFSSQSVSSLAASICLYS